jgi:pyruvate ferredoxin oxidoreductase alpha subunit
MGKTLTTQVSNQETTGQVEKFMQAKTGNEAMAEAMRQINPDVCAAYPITPATEIMQIFAGFVNDGLVKTELITVESEHSAMSACMGSAASGARTMTATSSQGLALMYEMLYIVAGYRLPIVMAEVNRALSGPLNIHCDHSDTMGARDTGWIQIFSENAQEAYDNLIQAVRIAEHPEVMLPAWASTDGFIISHGMENMHTYPDQAIRDFIGEYKSPYSVLNTNKPVTIGAADLQDFYFEHRRAAAEGMRNAKRVILEVGREFGKIFGTTYGFFDAFHLEDAEVALVALGSTAGTAKVAVDALRSRGIRAGLLKLRVFRPFPAEEIAAALAHVPNIAVMDRSDGFAAQGGPLAAEIKAAFFDAGLSPKLINFIYGLGGRDIHYSELEKIMEQTLRAARPADLESRLVYWGVRE